MACLHLLCVGFSSTSTQDQLIAPAKPGRSSPLSTLSPRYASTAGAISFRTPAQACYRDGLIAGSSLVLGLRGGAKEASPPEKQMAHLDSKRTGDTEVSPGTGLLNEAMLASAGDPLMALLEEGGLEAAAPTRAKDLPGDFKIRVRAVAKGWGRPPHARDAQRLVSPLNAGAARTAQVQDLARHVCRAGGGAARQRGVAERVVGRGRAEDARDEAAAGAGGRQGRQPGATAAGSAVWCGAGRGGGPTA